MAGLKPGPIAGTPGVIEDATVLVERNRITAVGPSSKIEIPSGARRIDVKGKTIIPGLIDVHAHVGSESSGLLAESSWPLAANVAFGVTTSHDPSNDTETVFSNAELIRACSRPARFSMAPRRPTKRSSTPTTTRCHTSAGRRRWARSR